MRIPNRLTNREEYQAFLKEVKALYLDGNSSHEIKEKLQIEQTVRQLQRLIKRMGITRTVGDSFRNAVSRKRVIYVKKKSTLKARRITLSLGTRFKILERDNFRCKKCGATASTRLLEIDHIDSNPANNKEENLQTLCEFCNMGKHDPNRKNTTTLNQEHKNINIL